MAKQQQTKQQTTKQQTTKQQTMKQQEPRILEAAHQSDLKGALCTRDGCTEDHDILYFHPGCHRKAPTWTQYDQRDGTVTVECADCGTALAKFQVAP